MTRMSEQRTQHTTRSHRCVCGDRRGVGVPGCEGLQRCRQHFQAGSHCCVCVPLRADDADVALAHAAHHLDACVEEGEVWVREMRRGRGEWVGEGEVQGEGRVRGRGRGPRGETDGLMGRGGGGGSLDVKGEPVEMIAFRRSMIPP